MLLLFIIPASIAANLEQTNNIQAQFNLSNQKLDVLIPPSLYNYYNNITHKINNDNDYAKYITPQAINPIAESIKNITRNLPNSNEQFANAILTLVHQIPYKISNPKYSIETLVDNFGDCDSLSLLAASIMKAGGLDVVLIHYTGINPGHMNVGVYLPNIPVYHTAGMAPTHFVYDNKTFWTAEATPDANWKVGDQADHLAKAEPILIPLENFEQSSPAQVSTSLGTPLLASNITINLSQEQSGIGDHARALTISGTILPTFSKKNVSIYVNNGSAYNYFRTVTNDAGGYLLSWNITSAGTYNVRASWSGVSNYAGADSETLTVFVGPKSFVRFGPAYNIYYLEYAQATAVGHNIRPLQGVDDFLRIPLRANVSFSYNFAVLQTGHTVSNVQSETITMQASEKTISMGIRRNRQLYEIQLPARTITEPIIVPQGLTPVRLPDDFNQTINDQFCFILQNINGTLSLNVNAMNEYEMSNITQGSNNNISFMNASGNIKENTWYNVTGSISDKSITSNLFNTNGTLVESLTMATPYNVTDSYEAIMLIANNVDSAVIFKDLTVQSLNSDSQLIESNEESTIYSEMLISYVSLSLLLVATFAAAVVYVKKKSCLLYTSPSPRDRS